MSTTCADDLSLDGRFLLLEPADEDSQLHQDDLVSVRSGQGRLWSINV